MRLLRKNQISASAIIQDFNRRNIEPDWKHEVNQGVLRLWRINNSLIAELYIGSKDGNSIPGTISVMSKFEYENTSSPQEIANDLMIENNLGKREIEMIGSM